jgi:GTP-binding protein YchF
MLRRRLALPRLKRGRARPIFSGKSASSLAAGIVGLPNVGKSTLFNALCKRANAAHAANFPFATIEPNQGIVDVPDARLETLASIARSARAVPASVEFNDIAGLVKGASEGEGLGNQFLSNIRQVDSVVHVVRCFENPQITHVDGVVSPSRDAAVINLELTLADLEQVERRLERLQKRAKTSDEKARNDAEEAVLREKIKPALESGTPVRSVELSEDDKALIKQLGLLTLKPVIYAANMSDTELASGNRHIQSLRFVLLASSLLLLDSLRLLLSNRRAEANKEDAQVVPVSAQVEAELVEIDDPEEREAFLQELSVDGSGLSSLVQAAYDALGLTSFFTAGEKEARAWTIYKGTKAPQAASAIHSDMERGFIRAEVTSYEHFVEENGWAGVREKGKARLEGKEYVMNDGDVRFNPSLHFICTGKVVGRSSRVCA